MVAPGFKPGTSNVAPGFSPARAPKGRRYKYSCLALRVLFTIDFRRIEFTLEDDFLTLRSGLRKKHER